MHSHELTRRQVLVRSAAAAAGLSLSMSMLAATNKARARVDPAPNPTADNALLNALLAAEQDAIKTYTAGAGVIMGDNATPADVKATVTKVALHFQQQHREHAAALALLITRNGGTPVADDKPASIPASFTSSSPNTISVIKLAADKEKAAAFSYADVMSKISTQAAAKLVGAIGGVESQHFVVLYLLAEGLITANAATNSMSDLVVPASFIVDVGLSTSVNLENLPALDTLLAFDVKP